MILTAGHSARWIAYFFAICSLILAIFFAMESSMAEYFLALQNETGREFYVASVIVSALTLDVLLPIPSSLVAISGAAVLGEVTATITLWLGFTIGSSFGYEMGRASRSFVLEKVGDTDARAIQWLKDRIGLLFLVIARPIPVLAETSTILAGTAKVDRVIFYSLCAIVNVPLSIFYVTSVKLLLNAV